MSELSDEELLADLDVEIAPKKIAARTPREERIIAGFEDIVKFREKHGRPPLHGEGRDIFERLYAVRLDQLRAQAEFHELLVPYDRFHLLDASGVAETPSEELDDEALLAELEADLAEDNGDITKLRHVSSREEKRTAEEIAERAKCPDFAKFKPLFERVKRDLEQGIRQTRRFGENAEIKQGEFFILGGQMAHVAEMDDAFRTDYGRPDRRLRVVYDNGTESGLLLRSLQRALYKDEGGRRITDPSAGPLFGSVSDDEDIPSGTLYVLGSLSEEPRIAQLRNVLHKIGITGGSVETRIAGASSDPTYLLAAVEIVATYPLFNINRTRLERLIHRVFGAARLDLEIMDRFGKPVQPREWFVVPLAVIDQVVERIRDGSIADYVYDPAKAELVKA